MKFMPDGFVLCVVLMLVGLTGCGVFRGGRATKPQEGAAVVARTDATNAASANREAAGGALEDANKRRLEALKANIDAARGSVQEIEPSAPQQHADSELGVAQDRLSDVKADAAEQQRAAERKKLIEQGRTEEALAQYATAKAEAKQRSDEIIALRVEVERLKLELASARAAEQKAVQDLIDKGEANRKAYEKQIADARDAALKEQSRWLTGVGLGCLLIFGLCAGFGQIAGIRVSWPFVILGLLALGLAQIVRQPWFMPACGAAIVIILIVVGAWVWRHYKAGDLAAEAQKRAAKLQGVAKAVIPVLDDAYDNGAKEFRDFLDEKVFAPLKGMMDAKDRATVHEIRAENSLSTKP